MGIDMIVIRPHERKGDVRAVRRRKKTVVQAAFAERTVFKKVEVEYEVVDPVFARAADFLLHHARIAFVLIPPEREFRLIVAGKTGRGILQNPPFRPAGSVNLFASRINMPVRKIVRGNNRFLLHGNTSFLF